MCARFAVGLPMLSARSFRLLFACVALLLSACATASKKPDLVRLYEAQASDPNQPPVVLIHGLMGSTLVDAQTHKQFWPGSLGALAFSNYADLGGANLVPGDLVYEVGGVDFYGELTRALETVGRFRRAQPGEPVTAGDRRRYYVYLYDWRGDNVAAARGLDELIRRIQADYHDPSLRVDVIAHSNGGLVANYYLLYGGRDVLGEASPKATGEGAKNVRRLLMLGTPHLGSATSVYRLVHGVRIGLRTVPVEVLATFATPFETLPAASAGSIVDTTGRPVAMDLFDPETWRSRQWSVYSPEVIARVRESAPDPTLSASAVAAVQAAFARHLVRGGQFQRALAVPLEADVDVATFGGDCTLTLARAILVNEDGHDRLAFTAREVLPAHSPDELTRETTLGLERLLFEPGDGLVTRTSQTGRARAVPGGPRPVPLFAQAQSFFLCESHGQLTANPYFQNNLLNFLLGQ